MNVLGEQHPTAAELRITDYYENKSRPELSSAEIEEM